MIGLSPVVMSTALVQLFLSCAVRDLHNFVIPTNQSKSAPLNLLFGIEGVFRARGSPNRSTW